MSDCEDYEANNGFLNERFGIDREIVYSDRESDSEDERYFSESDSEDECYFSESEEMDVNPQGLLRRYFLRWRNRVPKFIPSYP